MITKQKLSSTVRFDVFFMLPQWWPNNWLFTCVLVSPDSSTDALNNAPKTAFSRGKSSLIIPGWQHKGTPASGADTKQWLLGVCIKKTPTNSSCGSRCLIAIWKSPSTSPPLLPRPDFPFIKHLKLDLWLMLKRKHQCIPSKYIRKWAVQRVMINGC